MQLHNTWTWCTHLFNYIIQIEKYSQFIIFFFKTINKHNDGTVQVELLSYNGWAYSLHSSTSFCIILFMFNLGKSRFHSTVVNESRFWS